MTELFEQQCPIYMSYGMTYDEFWNGSPSCAIFYRKAALIQVKRRDEEFWMQGVYVYDALCRVSPILHAFSKSGTKPLPYVERPYMTQIEIEKEKETQEKKQENEMLLAKLKFSQWARATAKKFNKEKEGTNEITNK